jgi:hypothetical protein
LSKDDIAAGDGMLQWADRARIGAARQNLLTAVDQNLQEQPNIASTKY